MKIVEKENNLLSKAVKEFKNNKKIYVYGCGAMGKFVWDALRDCGVSITGFCVDKNYFSFDLKYENLPVVCLDDILCRTGILDINSAAIVVACRNPDNKKLKNINENIVVINEDAFSLWNVNISEKLDWSYVENHFTDFEDTYNMLEDEKSKEHMEAYINQKISGNFKYLETLFEQNQYFDEDIVNFSRIESFVDCGAYNGDSWKAFLNNYSINTGNMYAGKGFLLEPDRNNYQELIKNCAENENIILLCIGAGERKEELYFSEGEGTSARIDVEGNDVIEIDCLDNIIGGKVNFIKMDIEGAELDALRGAENIIKKFHPMLAVCVYHRREDLITIPQYIKSLYEGYRFYIRAYSRYAQELVLYAIPNK